MSYLALAKQIEGYSGLKTTFKQVDKKYCSGFIDYLKSAKNRNLVKDKNKDKNNDSFLSENTQVGYMKKFEAILNAAIADARLLVSNNFNIFPAFNIQNKQILKLLLQR